jgi:hypothetical protein
MHAEYYTTRNRSPHTDRGCRHMACCHESDGDMNPLLTSLMQHGIDTVRDIPSYSR